MTNEKNLEIEKKIEDIRNSFDQIFNSYLIGNETKIIEYFDENTDNYHTYCDSKFITTASRNKPYVLTYFILKNKGLFNTNFHKNYLSKENKLIKSQKVYSDTIKGIDTPQFDTFNILGYFVFKEKWKYINATTYQSYLNYLKEKSCNIENELTDINDPPKNKTNNSVENNLTEATPKVKIENTVQAKTETKKQQKNKIETNLKQTTPFDIHNNNTNKFEVNVNVTPEASIPKPVIPTDTQDHNPLKLNRYLTMMVGSIFILFLILILLIFNFIPEKNVSDSSIYIEDNNNTININQSRTFNSNLDSMDIEKDSETKIEH